MIHLPSQTATKRLGHLHAKRDWSRKQKCTRLNILNRNTSNHFPLCCSELCTAHDGSDLMDSFSSLNRLEEADDLSTEEVASFQNKFFVKLGYGDPKWLAALAANEVLRTATICAVLNNATQAVKEANKTLETLTPIKLKDLDEAKQLESELQKLHSIVQRLG